MKSTARSWSSLVSELRGSEAVDAGLLLLEFYQRGLVDPGWIPAVLDLAPASDAALLYSDLAALLLDSGQIDPAVEIMIGVTDLLAECRTELEALPGFEQWSRTWSDHFAILSPQIQSDVLVEMETSIQFCLQKDWQECVDVICSHHLPLAGRDEQHRESQILNDLANAGILRDQAMVRLARTGGSDPARWLNEILDPGCRADLLLFMAEDSGDPEWLESLDDTLLLVQPLGRRVRLGLLAVRTCAALGWMVEARSRLDETTTMLLEETEPLSVVGMLAELAEAYAEVDSVREGRHVLELCTRVIRDIQTPWGRVRAVDDAMRAFHFIGELREGLTIVEALLEPWVWEGLDPVQMARLRLILGMAARDAGVAVEAPVENEPPEGSAWTRFAVQFYASLLQTVSS